MVSELDVVNLASTPVLLIEGEALVGAKQNRVLNVSVLLAASTATTIPVSCVEQGRWGGERGTSRSARHTAGGLRKAKTMSVNQNHRAFGGKGSDQGEVWNEVTRYLTAHEVHSSSFALEDVYDERGDDLHSLVEGRAPLPGQVGMIVGYGGKVRALDLFDQPASFQAYWDALVSGAALDALTTPTGEAPTTEAASDFLEQLNATEPERGAGTGLGTDVRVDTDTLTATGLEWEGVTRHVAAFTVEPDERQPTPATVRARRQSPPSLDSLQRMVEDLDENE